MKKQRAGFVNQCFVSKKFWFSDSDLENFKYPKNSNKYV